MRGVALDEPLEAVLKADDLNALFNGFDGHGTDDAVESRRGAAPDKQGQPTGNRCEGHGNVSPG
jgi:hypothetical protein